MPGRRPALFALLALLAVAAGVGPVRPARAQLVNLPGTQPNLIFVLTDDQRFDQMAVMPQTVKNFNVDFTNAFVSTPLCCPSRATFLTGEYAHNHNVWTNYDYKKFQPREEDSLGSWLQDRGYFTGFFGKYLNRYAVDDPTPPGWDEFYARVGDSGGKLVHNGYTKANVHEHFRQGLGSATRIARFPDREYPNFYMTDYLADRAVRFIDRAESFQYNPLNKPWALVVWTNAPHLPMIPATRHAQAPVPPFVPAPSFLEPDMRDKPPEVRGLTYQYLNPWYHRKNHAGMLRMLMSVDQMVKEIWDTVDDYGVRSNTRGLFASDNGWFLGEHRKHEKVYAYEEASHIPFRLAIPGAGRRTIDALVSSVDAAPTLMDFAGDTSNHHFRGRSLLPLLDGTAGKWRDAVLIEARSALAYDAIRTKEWKYIRWVGSNHEELYDLRSDPYELRNLAPWYRDVIAVLRVQLDKLKAA